MPSRKPGYYFYVKDNITRFITPHLDLKAASEIFGKWWKKLHETHKAYYESISWNQPLTDKDPKRNQQNTVIRQRNFEAKMKTYIWKSIVDLNNYHEFKFVQIRTVNNNKTGEAIVLKDLTLSKDFTKILNDPLDDIIEAGVETTFKLHRKWSDPDLTYREVIQFLDQRRCNQLYPRNFLPPLFAKKNQDFENARRVIKEILEQNEYEKEQLVVYDLTELLEQYRGYWLTVYIFFVTITITLSCSFDKKSS